MQKSKYIHICLLFLISCDQQCPRQYIYEEYLIYSLLIDSLYSNSSTKVFVLMDSTFDYSPIALNGLYKKKDGSFVAYDELYKLNGSCVEWDSSETDEMRNNFWEKNKIKCRIFKDSIKCSLKPIQLRTDSLKSVFKTGWQLFYELFLLQMGLLNYQELVLTKTKIRQ